MIDLFIPSKNRAMQLRFLLESVAENMPSFFNEIKILYTYTDGDFKRGYEKLIDENILPNIVWQKEEDFLQDFLQCIESCKSDYICGMVDDCVVYKRVSVPSEIVEELIDDEVLCFSLRLGLNTYLQHYLEKDTVRLSQYQENQIGLKWNYSNFPRTSNYGYPISLDGHIYRPKELLEFSTKMEFNNLRKWEVNTAYSCGTDQSAKKHMASFKQSVLFSVPCNCVQYDEVLDFGKIHFYSEKDLNEMYLNNQVISFWNMQYAFQNVNCTHNEVEFYFENLEEK